MVTTIKKLAEVSVILAACVDAASILHRQAPTDLIHYFAFGDSYTTTSFNINADQPSPSNPMGNPALGQGTWSGGPNYVGYLTTKYNYTTVLAYDFAFAGATITDSQVPVTDPSIHTFEQQVEQDFEPKYTGSNKFWGSNSIFSIFFGINDIGLPLTSEPGSLEDINTRVPALLDAYFSLCDQLYNQGARLFLFVGVPPSDRSPYITGLGTGTATAFSNWVNTFNGQLAQRIPQFTSSHPGAVGATYDYHRWMAALLDSPTDYGFPDATCINSDGVSCVWWNNYHPGAKLNDLLAQRMLPALNSLGFDSSQPVGGYFY